MVGFNLAYFTPYNFWEYIRRVEPKMGERFDRAMHAVNINTIDAIPWLYPFDTLAAAGNILVDVGGGLGHVSKQILAAYPDSGLKCIVQDVVALCESVDRVNNLKLQLHSFFDPQPVRGTFFVASHSKPVGGSPMSNNWLRCCGLLLSTHLSRLGR